MDNTKSMNVQIMATIWHLWSRADSCGKPFGSHWQSRGRGFKSHRLHREV